MNKRAIVILVTGVVSCAAPQKPAEQTGPAASSACEADRFTIHEDQVLDKQTRLTWRRCPIGPAFDRASSSCAGAMYVATRLADAKSVAGRSGAGWRLPTIDEISSIAGASCKDQFARLFPTVSAPMWTSSSAGAGKVYQFDTSDGASAEDENDAAAIVLLVRK